MKLEKIVIIICCLYLECKPDTIGYGKIEKKNIYINCLMCGLFVYSVLYLKVDDECVN